MRIATAKQSYAADQALFDTATQRLWLCLLAAALVVFPFAANAIGFTWPAWWPSISPARRG